MADLQGCGVPGCPSCEELLGIVRDLRARVLELERTVAARDRRIEALESDNRKLRGLLAEAQRAGKRQAAPFSKGQGLRHPKTEDFTELLDRRAWCESRLRLGSP